MSIIAVTGSASGIGAATCAGLRQAGHEIVGVDLRSADVIADLGSPEGRQEAVEGVLGRCSGVLDGLVACAGLGPHVDDVSKIVGVNYFGTVALMDGGGSSVVEGEPWTTPHRRVPGASRSRRPVSRGRPPSSSFTPESAAVALPIAHEASVSVIGGAEGSKYCAV